jgi:hypothetical protein
MRHLAYIPKWQVASEVLWAHAEIASACYLSLIDALLLLHTASTALSAQPSGKSAKFSKTYMVYKQDSSMFLILY